MSFKKCLIFSTSIDIEFGRALNSGVCFNLSEGVSLNVYRADEGILAVSMFSKRLSFLCFQEISIVNTTKAKSLEECRNFGSGSDSRKFHRNLRRSSCPS